MFLMLFGCPKLNINHNSEKLKVIYKKILFCFMQEFKTSELKNLEKLVEQTVQCAFFTICEITFLEGGPLKSNVVLYFCFLCCCRDVPRLIIFFNSHDLDMRL